MHFQKDLNSKRSRTPENNFQENPMEGLEYSPLEENLDALFEVENMEDFYGPLYGPYRQFIPGAPPPPPVGGGGIPDSSGPPMGPPPSMKPAKAQAQKIQTGEVGIKAVDPGAIRPCTYRYVYIWLTNGREFWAWLTYVGRRSVAGWRWTGFRWVYFGIDTRRIESFICY